MRYENIKSGILTILVLVSILLTWNLWTYQPNYDFMDNGNTVAGVTVSEKQEVRKIIKPDQILFHIKGGTYGTNNNGELERVIREMSRWTIYDVKNYTDKVGNIEDLSHGRGNIEVIFPGEVPIELYRSVLNIEEKKIPLFNFNKIIINVTGASKEYGTIYFVSLENQQVYSSHISAESLNGFNRSFYKNAAQYPRYFAYKASERRTIFLPEEKIEMTPYKYFPNSLNSEDFKEALFNDPSFVQKSTIAHIEEYTNDSSKMTINYDTNILRYVNPAAVDDYNEGSYDLVNRSIDFVNEHGGWTDPFRYVLKDDYKHSVTFRLYSMDGYPVFNDQGLSEIKEEWGQDEINSYVRPSIALDLPIPTDMKKVIRPSGHTVLEYLQSKKDFKPELLDDLVLGYRMQRDTQENRLILLEPAWFYRYDKSWKEITMKDLGGPAHGLE